MLTYLFIFIVVLIIIDRLRNKNWFFQFLNIYIFWLYVLVHEIWHWIAAFIFWKWIDSINMSYTLWQIRESWRLWVCYFRYSWRLSLAIIAYSWELFTIFIWLLWWYLYWIWRIDILFYIFAFFFFLYFIYWKTSKDKWVWALLFLFFACVESEWFRKNDYWMFDFLDTLNLPVVKETISFVLLWFIIWWTITNIFKLKWHVWALSYSDSSWQPTSDAEIVKSVTWIPQTLVYWSWITLLTFVLCLNYSMMLWKDTWIKYIDEKVNKFEAFIKFKRNEKVIDRYENKDLIKEIKKT